MEASTTQNTAKIVSRKPKICSVEMKIMDDYLIDKKYNKTIIFH